MSTHRPCRCTALVALAALGLLAGCASAPYPRQNFDPAASPPVSSIALVPVAEPDRYQVYNITGVGGLFGPIGVIVSVFALEDHAKKATAEFSARLRETGFGIAEPFSAELGRALEARGFRVRALGKEHRPIVVKNNVDFSPIRADEDAVLFVNVEYAGYLSTATTTDYEPRLLVTAWLGAGPDRQIVYRATYNYGAALNQKEVDFLPLEGDARFGDTYALYTHAREAGEGIRAGMRPIAERIADALRAGGPGIAPAASARLGTTR